MEDARSSGYGEEMGERSKNLQISSYKVSHGDVIYSMMATVDYIILHVAKRVSLKSFYHTHRIVTMLGNRC